jgi:hypothetical protein
VEAVMKAVDVIIDMIETIGLKPMPKNQFFGTVDTGYVKHVLAGQDLIVIHRKAERINLRCNGSVIFISTFNKPIKDDLRLDLATPGSLDGLRSYLSE